MLDSKIIKAQAEHMSSVFDLARGKLDNHDCHLSGEDGCDCDMVSGCCGANTTEPCSEGSARCLDCGEGTVVEPECKDEPQAILDQKEEDMREHRDSEIKELNNK